MSNKDYITKIDSYYNKQKGVMASYLDDSKSYNFNYYVDNNDKNILEVLTGDKIILKAEYDLAGIYNLQTSIWYWGWNIDGVAIRSLVSRTKPIKQFAQHVKTEYATFDPKEADELYFRTSNGYFYVSPNNVDSIAKLALYLTKSIWYIPICHGLNNSVVCKKDNNDIKKMEYLLIKKIVQLG